MTDEAKALVEALKRYELTYDQRWKLVDLIKTQAREIERLRVAIGDIKEAWDWWNVDTYDRCASVVDDAIRAALAGDSHDQ